MTYYHVIIGLKSRPHRGTFEENLSKEDLVSNIINPYNKGEVFKCGDYVVSQDDISYIKITESDQALSVSTYYVSPESYFADHWRAINQMKDVTDKFIKTVSQEEEETIKKLTSISKNVFIVHGRDHKPMKELKVMLEEFGLTSIVLHEKASGGLTLPEKLERYSGDIGYAFITLTPDDVGCQETEIKKIQSELRAPFLRRPVLISPGYIEKVLRRLKPRARQNVIFEMGYFWGLLKRKKVCCLLKGDVEKPSDIEGIVYISFKESVNEIEDKIVKELEEAGYDIKT